MENSLLFIFGQKSLYYIVQGLLSDFGATLKIRKKSNFDRNQLKIFTKFLFLVYTLLLFLNLVLSIPGAIAVGQANDPNITFSPTNSIVTIVLGILWLFMLPIGALFCWFMPAYYAYR